MAGEDKGIFQIEIPVLGKPFNIPLAGTGSDDDTIKVAPTKKESKDKPSGGIKLKKNAPKHVKPGNWRDGGVIDGKSSGPDRSFVLRSQY